MAGGEGSRLRPLTINRPKPMVPIANRPIMEHILSLLKQHDITEILGTVHYLADEIQSYFGDGSDFDVSIEYSVEDEPLGTAGAVKLAEDYLNRETFLVISGDALTDCDLSEAIAFHKKKGAKATLVLYKVNSPLDFGIVVSDSNGRVLRFVEKPSWSEVFSDTVNTGIYIIEPEVLDLMEKGKTYDWSGDIFPTMLEKDMPIYGYIMGGYWCDIGSLAQYREAQERFLSGQIKLPTAETLSGSPVSVGTNTQIDPMAVIVPPVYIGRNCKIRGNARVGPYTVLGDNCIVEGGASVERTTTWDSAYIGPDARLQSSTLCSRVTVKKDTVVQEDAVIGDRCMLDVGCVIRSRVKLWPDKSIDRGSTLSMSLIWGNRWRGTLFRNLGVAGLSNIEITPDFACRLGSAFGSVLPRGSKVAISRDSTRSSRMIKRAVVSALLSVGCDVIDLHSLASPVARHFMRTGEFSGAVQVRKYPGNIRITLLEMLDSRGAYCSRALERKIESAFYREDFKRIDPDDLGVIESPTYAIENYQSDFLKLIQPLAGAKKLRVACDYGYGPIASFFPAMLNRLNIESISLNAFNEARLAPRTPDQIEHHVQNLREVVGNLRYDLGVLFLDEAERMVIVDNKGRALEGSALLAAMCVLVAQTQPGASFALSVSAPSILESYLTSRGATVIRTKAETRALTTTAMDAGVTFGGDQDGGFIYPEFNVGFDAAFALGKLLEMINDTGQDLSVIADEMPAFHLAYKRVRCVWEAKGSIMRHLSESELGEHIEMLDGVKLFRGSNWILILPDAIEPNFHLYAEGKTDEEAENLVDEFTVLVETLSKEIARDLPG